MPASASTSAATRKRRKSASRPRAAATPRAWKLELPEALADGELAQAIQTVSAEDYAARNPWTCASMVLSSTGPYTQRLSGPMGPYHVPLTTDRTLPKAIAAHIKRIWDTADDFELVEAFAACPRFPVPHPTTEMFKRGMVDREFPFVATMLAEGIRSMGLGRALLQAGAPLDASKRLGPAFSSYLLARFETVSTWEDLRASSEAVCVLAAGDKTLKEAARDHLGYKGAKGLDLIARVHHRGRERFVVGEAKFVGAGGGGQDLKITDSLNPKFAGSDLDVHPIALVDGLALSHLYTRPSYRAKLRDTHRPVVSALLLEDYLSSVLVDLIGLKK